MRRFSNILLMADAALESSVALKRAVALALSNQASLTLVGIVGSDPARLQMASTAVTPKELLGIAISEMHEQLEKVVKTTAKRGVDIEANVLTGKPFLEIIRQVLRNNHDLVIKCAEGATSLRDMLFGSIDMHLMRKCPCPVWVIKSAENQHYRRILAAVDQDPKDAVNDALNQQILEMSTSMALVEFSELHIVHAWYWFGEDYFRSPRLGVSDAEVDAMVAVEASEQRRRLENLVDTYGAKADKDALNHLTPQLHLIKGDAKHIVPRTARDLNVDLVVMGTVGRTGIPGFFMGNTAESILTQLDCSVLTVKPAEFISPVTLEA